MRPLEAQPARKRRSPEPSRQRPHKPQGQQPCATKTTHQPTHETHHCNTQPGTGVKQPETWGNSPNSRPANPPTTQAPAFRQTLLGGCGGIRVARDGQLLAVGRTQNARPPGAVADLTVAHQILRGAAEGVSSEADASGGRRHSGGCGCQQLWGCRARRAHHFPGSRHAPAPRAGCGTGGARTTRRGRPGYGAQALLEACLIKSLYGLTTWSETARLVGDHPGLRSVLGGAPSRFVCYRFAVKLHWHHDLIESCIKG